MHSKMRTSFVVILCLAAACAAVPADNSRIVQGSLTTIDNYPSIAAVLVSLDGFVYRHSCGSTILNQRSFLSAAHCYSLKDEIGVMYRVRVGSSFSESGGSTHSVRTIIIHPNYNTFTQDSDIAILQTPTFVVFNNLVQPGFIAGANYNVPENDSVWAAGWGRYDNSLNTFSPQLRHVEMWAISDADCRATDIGWIITNNMICAGLIGIGGPGQCTGDSGGPLYHQGTVVGVSSMVGAICGHPQGPSVNVLVSRFTPWIQANA